MTPTTPLVAIHCITYNQAAYIRQCLDGFIMQRTDFPFVAIVHDDCSTDGTDDIVREYAQRYPDIIKPIFETENQYSKKDGSLGRIMTKACNETGAKYIAMCEGDDYWTDPLKLQKQVDFLEKNPDCSLCYHAFIHVDAQGNFLSLSDDKHPFTKTCSLLQIIDRCPFQTATVIVRKEVFECITYKKLTELDFSFGDVLLFLSATSIGNLYGINGYLSAYRHHPAGATNSLGSANSLLKCIPSWMKATKLFDTTFCKKVHKDIIVNNILNGIIYYPNHRISFIKQLFTEITTYPYSIYLFNYSLICRIKGHYLNMFKQKNNGGLKP